jgi:hypothetical protein
MIKNKEKKNGPAARKKLESGKKSCALAHNFQMVKRQISALSFYHFPFNLSLIVEAHYKNF